jgi:hypothetical protein
MIPAKVYIVVMAGAGVVMILYGLGIGDIRVILGSFLFLGMAGFVYTAPANGIKKPGTKGNYV